MAKQYEQFYVAQGAYSGSTSTSNAWFVGDFRLLTVSVETSTTTSTATFIIQGSNADGLQAGDLGGPSQSTGWSNVTIILKGTLNAGGNVGRGVFTFDPPGWRWIRSATSADGITSSRGTVVFAGTTWQVAYTWKQSFSAMTSGSTATSAPFYVGDFRLLSVSVLSSASLGVPQAGGSIIIQGSNADGLGAGDLGGPTSNAGWSNITLIQPAALNLAGNVGQGTITLDPPGYRWVRSACSPGNVSTASATTILFQGASLF